jgi:hypothetical protein
VKVDEDESGDILLENKNRGKLLEFL